MSGQQADAEQTMQREPAWEYFRGVSHEFVIFDAGKP
jgi:hypothetical protein